MTIFIGGAWPYANGSLHLGHLTALLPGDIIARYYRLKGEKVLYVSGSDCHGTPIMIRAKQEGVSAKSIADRYHSEFEESFKKLGFSYDLYTRTDHLFHHQEVQRLFTKLLDKGYLYKKCIEQCYCEQCQQFLPDRYVEGVCPNCGKPARGDQCDYCSTILDPIDLEEKTCQLCGHQPTIKETEHYYFSLSSFQEPLEHYVQLAKKSQKWRDNALGLTTRYLQEGLQDRAATRDLDYGVTVPINGFENKKIYVWIEAVSGYLTASKQWAREHHTDWIDYWDNQARSYYVHGKDNIPFHTIIWPAILLGLGQLELPDTMISSEYLTIENKKLSTSQNWAVWVPDLLADYHPDSIRYFLTINHPDKRDADFSWREFIYSHNSELLGAFGNFVHRSLKFIQKSFANTIPSSIIDSEIRKNIISLYVEVGELIEEGNIKRALEVIFQFIRKANKYFDEQKPWIQLTNARHDCEKTLYTSVQIIVNLSQLLSPFIPFSCEKIRNILDLPSPTWHYFEKGNGRIEHVEPLFHRIDLNQIDVEVSKLVSKRKQ